MALNYLKYMAFFPNPPNRFTLADVKFTDTEFHKLNLLGNAIYNANNPDLHAFAAQGGKLILYHGWADQSIPPWSTLDYYAAVERASGGFRASQAFSRLYMIPGAYHCLYAPDRSSINLADFLTPLISWVQHGTPPGTITADTLSLTTSKITLRQKVQPYNALAPITPAPHSLNGHYHYLGTYHQQRPNDRADHLLAWLRYPPVLASRSQGRLSLPQVFLGCLRSFRIPR